jgi:hypothetical protein
MPAFLYGDTCNAYINAMAISRQMLVRLGTKDGRRTSAVSYYQHWTKPSEVLANISMLKLVEHAADILNTYRVATRGLRRHYIKPKRDGLKSLHIPEDYYIIELAAGIYDVRGASTATTHLPAAYAYDVKAKDQYRARIGTLPIDSEKFKALIEDPRRVIYFSLAYVSEEHLKVLKAKGLTPGHNHWIAILKYRCKSYVANSKGGTNPYVPSIHVE